MKSTSAAVRGRQTTWAPAGRNRSHRVRHMSPIVGRTRSISFEVDMCVGSGRLSEYADGALHMN